MPQEDLAMKKPKLSRSVSDLIALVDSIVAYWKSIAEANFKKANPDADLAEFERGKAATLRLCDLYSQLVPALSRPHYPSKP